MLLNLKNQKEKKKKKKTTRNIFDCGCFGEKSTSTPEGVTNNYNK